MEYLRSFVRMQEKSDHLYKGKCAPHSPLQLPTASLSFPQHPQPPQLLHVHLYNSAPIIGELMDIHVWDRYFAREGDESANRLQKDSVGS